MISLNWKQRLIAMALAKWQRQGRKKFKLDELMPEVYGGASESDPKNPRVALASGLRTFGFKLSSEKGFMLRRSSTIGRGHVGEYEFKGDFAKLLKENSK